MNYFNILIIFTLLCVPLLIANPVKNSNNSESKTPIMGKLDGYCNCVDGFDHVEPPVNESNVTTLPFDEEIAPSPCTYDLCNNHTSTSCHSNGCSDGWYQIPIINKCAKCCPKDQYEYEVLLSADKKAFCRVYE